MAPFIHTSPFPTSHASIGSSTFANDDDVTESSFDEGPEDFTENLINHLQSQPISSNHGAGRRHTLRPSKSLSNESSVAGPEDPTENLIKHMQGSPSKSPKNGAGRRYSPSPTRSLSNYSSIVGPEDFTENLIQHMQSQSASPKNRRGHRDSLSPIVSEEGDDPPLYEPSMLSPPPTPSPPPTTSVRPAEIPNDTDVNNAQPSTTEPISPQNNQEKTQSTTVNPSHSVDKSVQSLPTRPAHLTIPENPSTDEFEAMRKQVEQLHTIVKRQEKEKEFLQCHIHAQAEELYEKTAENSELYTRMNTMMKEKFAAVNDAKKPLQSQIQAQAQELYEKDAAINEKQNKIESLISEKTIAVKQMEDETKSRYEKELFSVRFSLREAAVKNERLTSQYSVLESSLKSSTARAPDFESENKTLKAAMATRDASLLTTRRDLQACEAKISAMTSAAASLDAEIASRLAKREQVWEGRVTAMLTERDQMAKVLLLEWGRRELPGVRDGEGRQAYKYKYVKR